MKNAIVIWPTSNGKATATDAGNVATQNITKALSRFQEDV
jgi:hypothetical protein